jgi:tetratricopeptide (TPR) repeat protein
MSIKVALTYIVKDDSQKEQFEESLKSFTPYFDKVYVAVTGTSGKHDEIHKLVKKYGGYSISTSPETHPQIYHQWEEDKWEFARFHEARNVAFGLVPADKYDYISWADHDDILVGGEEIKGMLQQAKDRKIDLVFCTYFYANVFKDNGEVDKTLIFHERERFIKPGVGNWKSHLHEVFMPNKPVQQSPYSQSIKEGRKLAWVHTATNDSSVNSLNRNIRILELQAKEENYSDARTIFYLAKTYFDIGPSRYNDVEKYINMYIPMSGWPEEIGNAFEYKAMVYANRGNVDKAMEYFKESIKFFPENHTSYLRLIELFLNINQMDKAETYLKFYETLPPVTSKATISTPLQVDLLYYTVKWLESEKKGKLQDCIMWAEKRHDLILDNLLMHSINLHETNLIAQGVVNLATYYLKNNQISNVKFLIDQLPKHLENEQFVKSLIDKIPGEQHSDKSIVYFASFYQPHFEKWNGDNLKVGIGGSESAVIYLSEEWVKLGYDVTVYCDTEEDKVINGVIYKKYWKINWNDLFNILITWRTPAFLDFNVSAKKHFVDLHDIANATEWTEDRCNKVDKVFFKSTWHARQIPQLPKEKRVVISNGITL